MVVFGPGFFSAVRVCQGSCDPVPCLAGEQKCEKDDKIPEPAPGYDLNSSDRGAGRSQQSEHGYYYPRDRSYRDLYCKPQVFTVYLDGVALESYRLERIAIWRNPEKYEKGYQTLQGLYAIGSGGLFGRGLGNSVQKLGFLPEAQNDMIFSIICEELGLVGASVIVILFLVLIWRFFVIATRAKDLFGALIASGAMAHMMIQVILNIAVVTNTIPNTGITLPFISYGGTSVLFLLLEMGLVLSVSSVIE